MVVVAAADDVGARDTANGEDPAAVAAPMPASRQAALLPSM
jgi:hypothetical protein